MFVEFSFDAKVQAMSEAMQRRLVMLFCLHCQGDLEKLDTDEIAAALRITVEDLNQTRTLFVRKGFLTEKFLPKNWDKRQRYDPTAAERMRRIREQQRNTSATQAQHDANGNGACCALDTDTELDTELDTKEPPNPRKRGNRKPYGEVFRTGRPDWCPEPDWEAYIEARRKKRGADTPLALGQVLAELDRLKAEGTDPLDSVRQSARGTWSDVYAVRRGNGKATPSPVRPSVPSVPFTPEQQAVIDRKNREREEEDRKMEPMRQKQREAALEQRRKNDSR